jgi:hypothetical protein
VRPATVVTRKCRIRLVSMGRFRKASKFDRLERYQADVAEDMGRYRKEFEVAVRAEDVTLLRVKPHFEKSIKHYFPSTES